MRFVCAALFCALAAPYPLAAEEPDAASPPAEAAAGEAGALPPGPAVETPAGKAAAAPSEAAAGEAGALPPGPTAETPAGKAAAVPSEAAAGQAGALPSGPAAETPAGKAAAVPAEAAAGQAGALPPGPAAVPAEAAAGEAGALPPGPAAETPAGKAAAPPAEAAAGEAGDPASGETFIGAVGGIHEDLRALGDWLFVDKEWLWFIARVVFALVITVSVAIFIRFVNILFAKMNQKAVNHFSKKPGPAGASRQFLFIRLNKIPFLKNIFNVNLFDKALARSQLIVFVSYIIRILKYFSALFTLYLALTAILGLFDPTRGFASTLLGYIWQPLKNFFGAVIGYLPDLFFIIVTIVIVRYLLRIVRFFANQIERGRIVIPGFHTDWAAPTYKLLQIFIAALTLAVIYPHLPNANSDSFKGVSVLLGLVVSFGSSSAIGNLVAGIVITYMRTFKIGDLIKIGDITGFVSEKSAIVTRVRTAKNEYVTFPNITILTSSITNFHMSLETGKGLVIHKEVTVAYDVPWRQVHEMLISAALKTAHVTPEPPPFVYQTALDDFYCRYEINAYTWSVDKLPLIYSDLYKNIQDAFAEKGLSLSSPHLAVAEIHQKNDTARN